MMHIFLATRVKLYTFFAASLLIFSVANAEGNLNEKINEAVKSYQNKDYEAAKNSLAPELLNHPNDSILLYNLGLAEYKLGKVGLAIAYWRKALEINPRFSDCQLALNFALSQAPLKQSSSEDSSTWSWIYSKTIEVMSFHTVFPLFLIIISFSLFKLARYLGSKKRALLSDESLPTLSNGTLVSFFLSGVFFILSTILLNDLLLSKATVVSSAKGLVHTGPSNEDATIYEVPEGTQVIIRDTSNGWYKIEDPNGKTGWMSSSELFITTENI